MRTRIAVGLSDSFDAVEAFADALEAARERHGLAWPTE